MQSYNIPQLAAEAASVESSVRKHAENAVEQYQQTVDTNPGFASALLEASAAQNASSSFASIVLKNTIKKCWNESTSEHALTPNEKAIIRDNIIDVAVKTASNVLPNLSEAVSIIATTDFPNAWPTAVEKVVAVLTGEGTMREKTASLAIAHSVLQKYREVVDMSDNFVMTLKSVYASLSQPLVNVMENLLHVAQTAQNDDALVACKGLTAAVDTLRDISSSDLGDEFIKELDRVSNIFLSCFTLQNPALNSRLDSLIDLKSSVTSCLSHFLIEFDEDFEKYASRFIQEVLTMISNNNGSDGSSGMYNDLIIKAIDLLSNACQGCCRSYFAEDAFLTFLVDNVIIPNLLLLEEDEELFTEEPAVYILNDIEGSDQHTRRRAISGLVRVLLMNVPNNSRPIFVELVKRLFADGATNWKTKDAAIYLASNISLQGSHTDSHKGVSQNQLDPLIPLSDFLGSFVFPEISSPKSEYSPYIIKADCLRVVTLFRNLLDVQSISSTLSVLPNWLNCDNYVVVTYAANALSRFILQKQGSTQIVTEEMFRPLAGTVLEGLCKQISSSSEPNSYLMQCLMNICRLFPQSIEPYLGDVVLSLNGVLYVASRNPSNPLFSHCLFETLSICIAKFPSHYAAFEQTIWENLIFILSNDVVEYMPYVLQIISQLLSCYPKELKEPPENYKMMLEPLTQMEFYSVSTGVIPGAVCLLTTFIEQYAEYIHNQPNDLTNRILNIFRYLIQLKSYDHEGMNIITTMLLAYPQEVMDKYIRVAVQLMLKRLQEKSTPKFVRILLLFFSVTTIIRGANAMVNILDGIQSGLFANVLQRVWLPEINKIKGDLERKFCVVSVTKLLTESEQLISNGQLWCESVLCCLKILHLGVETDDHTSFVPKDISEIKLDENVGFTNVFCPLHEAVHKPIDVCANVTNVDGFFRTEITAFLRGQGAPLVAQLQSTLTPEQFALLS